MTRFPPTPDPRGAVPPPAIVLRADAPAELLAQARAAFAAEIRDALVILGHDGTGGQVVLTRTPLREVIGGPVEHLEGHFGLLMARGVRRGLGLVVLGDGQDPVPPAVLDEVVGTLGPLVLGAAERLLPTPLPLDSLWVIAGGTAHRLLLVEVDADGVDVAVSPPVVLPDPGSTTVATPAAAGAPVHDAQHRADLADVAAHLLDDGTGVPRRLDDAPPPRRSLAQVLDGARQALARRRCPAAAEPPELFMTDCERVLELLRAVGPGGQDWDLLALLVHHRQPRRIAPEQIMEALTSDPRLRPDQDVCAGGSWYEDLVALRSLVSLLDAGPDGDARRAARSAWRGLTSVLILLSWWNHRYASAGELVDELTAQEPHGTLAPLLARLIDTPIPPAWWPTP